MATPLRLLALAAATFVLFACAVPPNGANSASPQTTERDEGPETTGRGQVSQKTKPTRIARVITLSRATEDDATFSEDRSGPFVSWGCKDYPYGDRIVVEIGRFGAAIPSEFGFILYDGSSSGELTSYQRKGVNQRWDWGPKGEFAFVLKPDGTGLFYDFSNVSQGEMTGADDLYKCSRR